MSRCLAARLLLMSASIAPFVAFADGADWDAFGPAGSNGIFFTITPELTQNYHGNAIASDHAGRIHVLESVPYAGSNDVDCAVVSYLANGRELDMHPLGVDFVEGLRRVFFDLGGSNADDCHAIATDSQNRVVLAGESATASGVSGVLARLGESSGLDGTFNSTGKIVLANLGVFSGQNTHLFDVRTLADDSVLACGAIESGSESHMLVLRFTPAGQLDPNFNSAGFRIVVFDPTGNDAAVCNRLQVLPNGDVVAAGTAHAASGGQSQFAAVRMASNGTPIPGFGNNGNALIPVAGGGDILALDDVVYDATRSRLLLGGGITRVDVSGVYYFCQVAVVDTAGNFDVSFNGSGLLSFQFSDYDHSRTGGNCMLKRILLRDDGSMTLAGTHLNAAADAANYGSRDVGLVRLDASGNADSSFGYGGGLINEHATLGYSNVPGNLKPVVADTLDGAMLYKGNLVLLSERNRYPQGSYAGATYNQPGPMVPVVGGIAADHIFDDGFEFDGLAEPATPLPSIPVPAGYGNYCSVRDAVSGGAGLQYGDATSDPCQVFLNSNPNLIVDRAGLWSMNGTNYVKASCSYDGLISLRVGTGTAPINAAFNDTNGHLGCTFDIAPASLPVFARPYSGVHPPAGENQPYDHDPFYVPLDVSQFGQTPSSKQPLALTVDTFGLQQSNDSGNCIHLHGIDEAASDIIIGERRTNQSVAAGRVAVAVPRYVLYATSVPPPPGAAPPTPGDPYQREVWIRHRVGSGRYSEEFVTFYAHGANTQVLRGQSVAEGTPVSDEGTTGAASGLHLHFATYRTKNLAWRSTYEMDWRLSTFGNDKEIAAMDAWGWQAPQGVDPEGWRYRDPLTNPYSGNTITDAGTWSINMWKPGEESPMPQYLGATDPGINCP